MKHLLTLNKYIFRYKWRLLIGTICVILSNYFKAKVPQAIREALDFVLEGVNTFKSQSNGENDAEQFNAIMGHDLFIFGMTVLGYAAIMGVFMYFMRQTIIYNSRLIEYDLRKDIYDQYQKLDTSFYKVNKTGDMMARITEDVSKIRMYLGPAMLYGINLISLFAMIIYSMFRVNPTLSIYTLIPLPFLSLSIYLVSSSINKRSEAIQAQLSNLNSFAQEIYSGISVIKSYVKEEQFSKSFATESDSFKDKSMDLAKINAMFYPLMILLISISTLLTVLIGGIQVTKGLATPGNIAEFVIYVNMLTWPVTAIGWIASIIQQAEASQKRINEFLHTEPLVSNTNDKASLLHGKIQFKEVTFEYPENNIRALNNINFTIGKGENLIIVGKTASGKSTIAELLLRMYDVTKGQILIDDKPITEINLGDLRNSIGYVPQDVFLFSNSIEENVAFGRSSIEDEKIKSNTTYAAVRKDIDNLPKGFKTQIGERGVALSGGQKQRLSLARALIMDPEIIILDDCLSAVDTTTEQTILGYLNTVLSNKTSIIITHRIFNNLTVDKIIVLDEGQIVEMGTHDELVALKGQYYTMLESQNEEEKGGKKT